MNTYVYIYTHVSLVCVIQIHMQMIVKFIVSTVTQLKKTGILELHFVQRADNTGHL